MPNFKHFEKFCGLKQDDYCIKLTVYVNLGRLGAFLLLDENCGSAAALSFNDKIPGYFCNNNRGALKTLKVMELQYVL